MGRGVIPLSLRHGNAEPAPSCATLPRVARCGCLSCLDVLGRSGICWRETLRALSRGFHSCFRRRLTLLRPVFARSREIQSRYRQKAKPHSSPSASCARLGCSAESGENLGRARIVVDRLRLFCETLCALGRLSARRQAQARGIGSRCHPLPAQKPHSRLGRKCLIQRAPNSQVWLPANFSAFFSVQISSSWHSRPAPAQVSYPAANVIYALTPNILAISLPTPDVLLVPPRSGVSTRPFLRHFSIAWITAFPAEFSPRESSSIAPAQIVATGFAF